MRFKTITLAMLIGSVTSVVSGQTSPPVAPETPQSLPPVPQQEVDAAMKRVEQRQSEREASGEAPATQPNEGAGTISEDPSLMREEILRLRREVTALRQRNSDLISQLVTVQPDRSDLRQLQDQLRVESEPERRQQQQDDVASQRNRDQYERDRRFNETPFGGRNRDVIIVQPNDPPREPAPNPVDPTPPAPAPGDDAPRDRTPQPPPTIDDRYQPGSQGSQQGGARPGNEGPGNPNDGGANPRQGGSERPGGSAR